MENSNFVYVYLLYYYDPYAEGIERFQQCNPIVYSTFEQAVEQVKQKTGEGVKIITPGSRWSGGYYWIDRQPIIDSHKQGLEYEVTEWNPHHDYIAGRVKLELSQ